MSALYFQWWVGIWQRKRKLANAEQEKTKGNKRKRGMEIRGKKRLYSGKSNYMKWVWNVGFMGGKGKEKYERKDWREIEKVSRQYKKSSLLAVGIQRILHCRNTHNLSSCYQMSLSINIYEISFTLTTILSYSHQSTNSSVRIRIRINAKAG